MTRIVRFTPTSPLALWLATLTAACLFLQPPAAQAATVGSGKVATEIRTVPGDFDAIALAGSIDLVVHQAAKQAVTVSADDNVLALIETVVEQRAAGPTLVIRFKRGESLRRVSKAEVRVDVVHLRALSSAGSGDLRVGALTTPTLKLSLSGSSDARLQGLSTGSLEVSIAGSGDIGASGSAKQVRVGIAGSGDADLAALNADAVSVHIAGSGDASVTANQQLEVSIAGSGDVRYGGAVTNVKSSVAGSGSVTRR
ncbi:MAG: hypothetical protein ABT20_11930 [Rubrivivax sp. SCN 70-15]|nr:MAG: hypothetical protein ABT20_11930 [Rubrivivax sp. SCN 70-15]